MTLRQDAKQIIKESISRVLPDEAVKRTLDGKTFAQGNVYLGGQGSVADGSGSAGRSGTAAF